MSEKIGVGIITCNRPDYLLNLIKSINLDVAGIDTLLIINDGDTLKDFALPDNTTLIKNEKNLGVAKSKNKALRWLLANECDYFFLIEDDMLILDQTIFKQYINACKLSGIQHFNYGPGSPFNRKQVIQNFDLHNRHLLDQNTEPNPKLILDYKDCKIALYEHTVAMFSFFTKRLLTQNLGFMNEEYDQCWEHVCSTYDIIKAGFHPPFWWFADLANSHELLTEAPGAIENSVIANDKSEWMKKVMAGREIYKRKHGHYPNHAPQVSKEEVIQIVKNIKKKYSHVNK